MKKSFLAWILTLLMMITLNAVLAEEAVLRKPVGGLKGFKVSEYIPRGESFDLKIDGSLQTGNTVTFTVDPPEGKTVSSIFLGVIYDSSVLAQYEVTGTNTLTYKFYEPGHYIMQVDYNEGYDGEYPPHSGWLRVTGDNLADKMAEEIAESCPYKDDKDDYRKVVWVHDYLAKNSYYDGSYSYYDAGTLLEKHYGVCQSFSFACSKILDAMEIENTLMLVWDMEHAWNCVKVNGNWYMMDITWDTPALYDAGKGTAAGFCYHMYCLLPGRLLSYDHYGYTDEKGCTSMEDNYFMHEGRGAELVNALETDIQSAIASEGAKSMDVTSVTESTSALRDYYKNGDSFTFSHQRYDVAAELVARLLNGTTRTNSAGTKMNLSADHPETTYKNMNSTVALTVTDASHTTSGGCGASLNWLYANNILTISGTGAMINYTAENPAPWIVNYGTQITDVVIESGATSIGTAAFSGCSALADVAIPASVTTIGDDAFCGCSALAKASVFCASAGYTFASEKNLAITFNHQNLEEFAAAAPSCTEEGNIACWYCDACGKFYSDASWETEISEDSAMIPALGHSIEHQAYQAPTLTEDGNIEYWYCSRCDIRFMDETCTTEIYDEETVLPALCVDQGYCGDPAVNGGKDLTWVLDDEGTLFISGTGAMINYTAESPAPWTANYGAQITKVVIESGAASIGAVAFSGCSSLTEICIPSTVTSFGRGAFEGCSGIQTISVPSGVRVLPEYVFYSCSSLASISIPVTVTGVSKEAFNLCGSLRNVVFAGTEAQWRKISISAGNDPLKNAVVAKVGALKLTLPNKLTSISAGAFAGTKAGIIVIPNTCESIGEGAFAGCPNLMIVYLPRKLKDYEDCFSNKNGLQIHFIYQ